MQDEVNTFKEQLKKETEESSLEMQLLMALHQKREPDIQDLPVVKIETWAGQREVR